MPSREQAAASNVGSSTPRCNETGDSVAAHTDSRTPEEWFDHIEQLEAENRRLREEIRIREESQIPVIPHGAAVELERLRVENERLRTMVARIRNNAEAWHGDDAAKGRALAVIAEWAQEALDA